jgi:hypothetical protein
LNFLKQRSNWKIFNVLLGVIHVLPAVEEVLDLQGAGPLVPASVEQPVGLQVIQALAHEFLVAYLGIYPGTIVLGHLPAYIVPQITVEEGPGQTDLRLSGMDRATGLRRKKDTAAILPGGKVESLILAAGVALLEDGERDLQ